jgi:hypothetical protein
LDPLTLEVERVYPLGAEARFLTLSPDGRHAYYVAGERSLGGVVMHLDLLAAVERQLVQVSWQVMGLAATADRVYAVDSAGSLVWSYARSGRTAARQIGVGKGPVGIFW